MSKRKRMTGKAEEMRQIAQVLRQNGLPDMAVRTALLSLCGVALSFKDDGESFETPPVKCFLGLGGSAKIS